MITKEDWTQWVNSSITQAYKAYLQESIDKSISRMLNLDPGLSKDDLESYAIKSMAQRFFIDGLSQAIDFESFSDDLIIDREGGEKEYYEYY